MRSELTESEAFPRGAFSGDHELWMSVCVDGVGRDICYQRHRGVPHLMAERREERRGEIDIQTDRQIDDR